MPQTTTGLDSIARVIVPVHDQDRAIDFYVGKLGFEQISDVPFGDGHRWVEVSPPGGGPVIAPSPPMGGAIGVPTGISFRTSDIDALHRDLSERGVDVDPEVMRMGDPTPPMFFFRDQDGNVLHVAEEG
jgi:catechol 2,3-dioxygenase-like lactoylglutathione lyase family enzyme